MAFEQTCPSDVTLHGFHALVPADFHHAQHVRAGLGRAGEEACPQGVTGELPRIETSGLGVRLHDQRHGLRGERVADVAVLVDRAEQRVFLDPRRLQPRLESAHRPELVAAGNGNLLPLAFLVGLRAPDLHAHAFRFVGEVGDFECYQGSE